MPLFTFRPEPDSRVPLYIQIYEAAVSEIQTGMLKPEGRMPSKRSLAEHLGVSLNTIEAAYAQLLDEGYICSRPRKGYYVSGIYPKLRAPDTQLKPAVPAAKNRETPGTAVQFDLLSNSVDFTAFPRSVLRNLYREVLSGNENIFSPGDERGDPGFREAIAGYLHGSRGVQCTPEDIIIGAGTEYLIQLIQKLLGRECLFAVENPGYLRNSRILAAGGSRIVPVPVDSRGLKTGRIPADNGGAPIAVCVTPSHQFPLGITMPAARRMELLEWAVSAEERYIIEDDYDSEYRFSGKPIPALQGMDSSGRVIYIGTFSRSLASSMRISYMVLPPHLMRRFREKLSFYSCTVSRIEQAVLERFLSRGHFERHLNRMRTLYRRRRDTLIRNLTARIPGILIGGANGGLHLTITVPAGVVSEGSEKTLTALAEAEGVRVYGVSGYYMDTAGEFPEGAASLEAPRFVAGYSHLNEGQIEEIAERLARAWQG